MNAGERIILSGELIESIGMQVEDMASSLIAITETTLENGDFGNLRSAGRSRISYETSASGWNHTSYGISFPVMEKKRRKSIPRAWINYQISIFGGGIPTDQKGLKCIGPVVHISFWHEPTDFDDPGLYVEFPPAWDDCGIKDERLLVWDGGKLEEFPQWTFSIRLLDLHNEDALRKSIIEPMQALLANIEVAIALPADLPGLVFYTSEDQRNPGWNLIAREHKSP